MALYQTDPLYLALKAALTIVTAEQGADSNAALTVLGAINALRHECAWADPDSVLRASDNGITTRVEAG